MRRRDRDDGTGRESWSALVRDLGQAVLELMRAEVKALGADVGEVQGRAIKAAALLVVALVLLAWGVGVATAALILVLAIWLPPWGAALTVLGLLVLGATVLTAVAWWRYLRHWESPLVTAGRRFDEYVEWWNGRVLEPEAGRLDSDPSRSERPDHA